MELINTQTLACFDHRMITGNQTSHFEYLSLRILNLNCIWAQPTIWVNPLRTKIVKDDEEHRGLINKPQDLASKSKSLNVECKWIEKNGKFEVLRSIW